MNNEAFVNRNGILYVRSKFLASEKIISESTLNNAQYYKRKGWGIIVDPEDKRCRLIDLNCKAIQKYKPAIIAKYGDPNAKPEPTEPYLPWSDLTTKQIEVAMAQYNLVKQYRLYAQNSPKSKITATKHEFVDLVCGGYIHQHEYETIGRKLSFQTIERWDNKLRNGKDIPDDLFPPVRQKQEDTTLTPSHVEILKSCWLQKNAPKKQEAIKVALAMFKLKGLDLPTEYKCAKWIDRYSTDNAATCKFIRESKKAMLDGMMPYIERDIDQINFMDVLVADGHTCNNMVINPDTGKPARPTIVAWVDMRTLMIMGFEIMFVENTMSVASSLRMACLNGGRLLGIDGAVLPRMIYTDNGKAFKNKYFNEKVDLEHSVGGLFDRLKMYGLEHVAYSIPYNAKTKVIERVWGILGRFERRDPFYTGYNIESKPANLMRNETLAKELFNKHVDQNGYPTLWEFYATFQQWITEYNQTQGNGKYLNGHSPISLATTQMTTINFEPRVLPKSELTMLMMHEKTMKLNAMGFRINNKWYYNHLKFPQKDKNTYWRVKWDMLDDSYILVFEEEGPFWCEAKMSINQNIHPATALGSDEHRQQLAAAMQWKNDIVKSVEDHARQELGLEPKKIRKKQLELVAAKKELLCHNEIDDDYITTSDGRKIKLKYF